MRTAAIVAGIVFYLGSLMCVGYGGAYFGGFFSAELDAPAPKPK